jgi:peptidoglycan/xylan/chitin deacetylase (PgdA/CDA1 family)
MTRLSIKGLFVACFGFCLSLLVFPAFVPAAPDPEPDDYKVLKEIITLEFSKETPHERGAVVPGVKTRMNTDAKVVAVTLDVDGKDINTDLLKFFEQEKIPVTLFMSGGGLDRNAELVKRIAVNPQFEIANLGLEAKSCSVDGQSPDGKPATRSAEEVFTEIEKNARKIEDATGILPRFFRAGNAYYDDVSVRIARALGYEVIGSTVSVEPKPGKLAQSIAEAMLKASSGSIATISVTNPAMGVAEAEGLKQAFSKLRTKGFQFVKLGDYPLE